MEGRSLRASAGKKFCRRRGAPPSIAPMVWARMLRQKNRGSGAVAIADVALPFASVFAAVRQ
jgi:hypothetical protein